MFITTNLKGTSLVWWKKIQAGKVRKLKEKISTCKKMEKLISKYLPSGYLTSPYQKLLGLL